VLKPVVARHSDRVSRNYFRGDAGFANPEMYDYLEAEEVKYAIRLPTNRTLQEKISHLPSRPVGRPPNAVRRFYASFSYQPGSWRKARRVVAKVEWYPGELCPRVGFIVTNMARPPRMSSPSTASAEPASSGSRKAKGQSTGCGCHADPSSPTPCVFSSTRSLIISAISCGPWRRWSRSRSGR